MTGWPAHAPSSPIEPRLLVTLTMRAVGARRSKGRKALMRRTTAKTVRLVDVAQIFCGFLGRGGQVV